MQDLLGTCTRYYVPFLARFLHNLAHIILQEMVQDFARDAASSHIFCKVLQELVQDCARTVQEKGHNYRVHVPSKSCMQDSCAILHDLASSFLLGIAAPIHSCHWEARLPDLDIVFVIKTINMISKHHSKLLLGLENCSTMVCIHGICNS